MTKKFCFVDTIEAFVIQQSYFNLFAIYLIILFL